MTQSWPEIAVGELYLVANPAGERAIVAIGYVESGARCVSIALCVPPGDEDDQSLRYRGVETGAPYDLTIQTDLVGPVARETLIERVGRLPDEPAVLHDAFAAGEFAPSLAHRRGLPLRGPDDARYAVIEAEGRRLDRFLDHDGPD